MNASSVERRLPKISDPRVTLLYPPNQTLKDYMCKPNGSLAYPNLGGALLAIGVDVRVFGACVGNAKAARGGGSRPLRDRPRGEPAG